MKAWKVIGVVLGVFVWIGIGTVVYNVATGMPDSSIYLGKQVPKRFQKTIHSLGLLESGEEIQYFYSDGIWDIKQGMYCVTDSNIALYSSDWEDPKVIIPFDEVMDVDVEYNPSYFEDSYVTVHTEDFEYLFPLSSEKGRDRNCIEYIFSKIPEMHDQEPHDKALNKIFNKSPFSPRSDPGSDREK